MLAATAWCLTSCFLDWAIPPPRCLRVNKTFYCEVTHLKSLWRSMAWTVFPLFLIIYRPSQMRDLWVSESSISSALSSLAAGEANTWHSLHLFDSTVAWQPRLGWEEPFLGTDGDFCSPQKSDDRCSNFEGINVVYQSWRCGGAFRAASFP